MSHLALPCLVLLLPIAALAGHRSGPGLRGDSRRDRFGQLPPPAVALFELRRLRLLARATRGAEGRGSEAESLRVFQAVTEFVLRRPLR